MESSLRVGIGGIVLFVLGVALGSAAQDLASEGESLSLSADAKQALLAHEWSGNVRELQNRIQRATLVRGGAMISAADLGLAPGTGASRELPAITPLSDDRGDQEERAAIEQALRDARGVVSRAAAQLGLSRQALYRRMERLGLEMERRFKS